MKIANEILLKIKVLLSQQIEAKGKASYAISKNLRKINQEIAAYEEFRNSLVSKYGEETENGGHTISMTSEHWSDFIDELTPVANESTEIEVYHLSDSDFDNIFCESWTPADYDLIYQLLVEHPSQNAQDK